MIARVDEQRDLERERPAVAQRSAAPGETRRGWCWRPARARCAARCAPRRRRRSRPACGRRAGTIRSRDGPAGSTAAAAPAIGEQRLFALAVDHARVGLGEHQEASQRRIDRRHQQAVVTPRERARDGAGGVAAEAVGEPPFAALGLRRGRRRSRVRTGSRSGSWVIHRAVLLGCDCARLSDGSRRSSARCAPARHLAIAFRRARAARRGADPRHRSTAPGFTRDERGSTLPSTT